MDYTVTIQEETEKVTQAVVHKSVEIIEDSMVITSTKKMK